VQAFPWLSVQPVYIGHFPAIAMSVSFSGELAWELHVPNEALLGCYRLLAAAGKQYELSHFGLYATESMRLEKGFRHWKADLITEFNPIEAGLDRFVSWHKDFLGKPALLDMQAKAKRKAFVTLAIDTLDAPAHPGDSLMLNNRVVGTISSASFGHRVQKNLALAYVDVDCAAIHTALTVQMLGKQYPAIVSAEVQYDPSFSRLKS